MKNLICAVLAFSLLGLGVSQAATFYYPKQEGALFSIQVPDDWKPEILEDGSLEAYSPDEKGYINAWILKSKEDYENLEKDINDLLEPWLKDVKLSGKSETIKSENDTEFEVFSGTGKDKEDGSAQGFEIFLFKITEGQVGVFFVQYSEDAPKDTVDALIKIAKSIKISE